MALNGESGAGLRSSSTDTDDDDPLVKLSSLIIVVNADVTSTASNSLFDAVSSAASDDEHYTGDSKLDQSITYYLSLMNAGDIDHCMVKISSYDC